MDVTLLVDHQDDVTIGTRRGVVVRALVTIAGTAPEQKDRVPLSLAFAIDRSGSMAGDRIESARVAAAHAMERVHPDDIVAVTTFDDTIDVMAPAAPRREQHALTQQLLAIEIGGSTNLSGGWLAARRELENAAAIHGNVAGSSRRIVLLTDGHANAGITDRETLVDLARMARSAGITTTTVGIGEGYDDDLLRVMADAGGGNSWYIERADQSRDVLGEELGNLLSVAAQGLSVVVTPGDAVELFAVHSTWPASNAKGAAVTFDMGDLYASEPKPLLVEFWVSKTRLDELVGDNSPIAVLTVTADVLTNGGVEHRVLHLPIASTLDEQATMKPEIEHAVLLARTAKAREEAARLQREGDADSAAQVMQSAMSSIMESPLQSSVAFAAELTEQARDLGRMGERYRSRQFSELEAKYQMQRSYNARRGKKQYDELLSRKEVE